MIYSIFICFYAFFTRFEALGTQDNTGRMGYYNHLSRIVGFRWRVSINLSIRIILLFYNLI